MEADRPRGSAHGRDARLLPAAEVLANGVGRAWYQTSCSLVCCAARISMKPSPKASKLYAVRRMCRCKLTELNCGQDVDPVQASLFR